MRDAVAEVLEQRSKPGGSPSVAVVASFAAHLSVALLVVAAANRQAQLPPQRVVTIRLAAPPSAPVSASLPSRKSADAAKLKQPEKPITEPEPAPPLKAPKQTSDGKSLFGRSDLQAPAKAASPAASRPVAPSGDARPSSATPTASPIPGVGKAGVVSLEGGPFPYSMYVDRMVGLVGTRWFRPEVSAELLVQVYFVVERNGSIRDVKIEKSSGLASFDRAAYRAVLESSPLPPLPPAYSGSYLGVHLTFH